MRFLIYGAGAVGGYIGGHLALAGHDVTMLSHEPVVKAVRERGLVLVTKTGQRTVNNLRAVGALREALKQAPPYQAFIFTMKAYDTVGAIFEILDVGLVPPPILCLQNGVGNEESLAGAFGGSRVAAGALTTAVSMPEPGFVVEEEPRGIALALDSPVVGPLVEALQATRLSLRLLASVSSLKWSKLLLDVIANATVAILDMPAREVFRSARLLNVEVAALLEALAILRLQGVEIVNLPRAPARTLTRLVERLPRTFLPPILRQLGYGQRGSQTMSSLHTDIALGRKRTEVAWLNGAIVQATEGMRRVAPINHALALIVSDIASGRVAWEMYRHKPEALLTAVRTTRGPLRYVE